MGTFTTSRGTRVQHVEPRFQIPYTPSPARREHIHGRIIPMTEDQSWIDRLFRWQAPSR